MRSPEPSLAAAVRSPYRWYLAALFPIGIGWFMYALEASEWQRLRLYAPMPAVGEFETAECITHRRGRERERMLITYTFAANGYVRYETPGSAQPEPAFRARDSIAYPSRDACEAALPAVRQAKAPHPVWFELSQPHLSKTTLEEPDSTRFLWLWLAALPLLAVGGILHGRRRRAG